MQNQSAAVSAGGSGFLPTELSDNGGTSRPGDNDALVTVCAWHEAEKGLALMLAGKRVSHGMCEACHKLSLAALGLRVVQGLDGIKRVERVNADEVEVAA
jgi:hypothetical protein